MEGKKAAGKALVAIAGIAIVAGVVAVGYYQEEVLGYFRLQGWNLQPAEQATKEFFAAAAKGDGTSVGKMVGKDTDRLSPIRSGDRVSGFNIMQYGGPKAYTLQQLVPDANPQQSPPRLVLMDGGAVAVTASFPGRYKLELRWDRTDQGWKIKGIDRQPDKPDG